MGFRGHDKEHRLEWKRWQERNRDLLLECGLPHDVWEEERNWQYFLDHASLSGRKRQHWFSLDQLRRSQLERLCDFLQQEFKASPYDPMLLSILKSELRLPQR